MDREYAFSELRAQGAGESVPETGGVSGKILKAFVALAVLFLAGELIWLLGVTPFRSFSGIDVTGGDISREAVLAKAGITGSSSFVSTDTRYVERALRELSSVESARAIKHFPDRLQIIIEGRHAVASALAESGGKTVPVLLDSHGVIFQVGGAGKELPNRLPVISGLKIEDPFPGMKLPSFFLPFFAELDKIQQSAPELLSAVSELRINPKSSNSFDLVLYPVHKKIKVRLSEVNEDLLRYTLLMIDVIAATDPGIDSLDFRAGIASYIPKEASSEQ